MALSATCDAHVATRGGDAPRIACPWAKLVTRPCPSASRRSFSTHRPGDAETAPRGLALAQLGMRGAQLGVVGAALGVFLIRVSHAGGAPRMAASDLYGTKLTSSYPIRVRRTPCSASRPLFSRTAGRTWRIRPSSEPRRCGGDFF